ncbi:MAG: hypothetical protein KF817_15520 [Phycisphaeraceae bacterium]|nr:hypothetical protein [Phycisphaeraceae bacterium]
MNAYRNNHRSARPSASVRPLSACAALIAAGTLVIGSLGGSALAASTDATFGQSAKSRQQSYETGVGFERPGGGSAHAAPADATLDQAAKARQKGYDLGVGLQRPLGIPGSDAVLDPQFVIDTGVEVRRNPDIDQNAHIGFSDLLMVLSCYGAFSDPLFASHDASHCDLDDDGIVGMSDLLIILAYWMP